MTYGEMVTQLAELHRAEARKDAEITHLRGLLGELDGIINDAEAFGDEIDPDDLKEVISRIDKEGEL